MLKIFNLPKAAISLALTSTSSFLLASSAWAQPTDNIYGRDLPNQTVCSFITGNNVNVRSGPSNQYKLLLNLITVIVLEQLIAREIG